MLFPSQDQSLNNGHVLLCHDAACQGLSAALKNQPKYTDCPTNMVNARASWHE